MNLLCYEKMVFSITKQFNILYLVYERFGVFKTTSLYLHYVFPEVECDYYGCFRLFPITISENSQ